VQPVINAYFEGERFGGLLVLVIGLSGWIMAALLLNRGGSSLARGLAIPLVVIGLIQVVVGAALLARTNAQVASLTDQVRKDVVGFKATEVARMTKVMNRFKRYKWLEIAFIIAGLLGALLLTDGLWRGLALGLLGQGAIMLAFDVFAEARAIIYLDAINRL
jgi:uncharacterized membrane protein